MVATSVTTGNSNLFATGAINTLCLTVTGSTVNNMAPYIPVEFNVIGVQATPLGGGTATVDSTRLIVTLNGNSTVADVTYYGKRK